MTDDSADRQKAAAGEREPWVIEASPLSYVLSTPPGDGGPPRPLLCFLHGYDEAAPVDIVEGVTRHGPLRPGSAARTRSDFIVVAPQLPRAGDLWHQYADAVAEIADDVLELAGGDPSRAYLTGFSFGGNGVFDLALAQPDRWAALWAVDPTRVPRADVRRPAWLSIGNAARCQTDGFVAALGLRSAADRIDGDRLYLDEKQDHVGSATRAYRDERIYQWLLTHHLP
jgi:poly(3-hydroxybutyrate) depolymerase